jgi:hypothetical protein
MVESGKMAVTNIGECFAAVLGVLVKYFVAAPVAAGMSPTAV